VKLKERADSGDERGDWLITMRTLRIRPYPASKAIAVRAMLLSDCVADSRARAAQGAAQEYEHAYQRELLIEDDR